IVSNNKDPEVLDKIRSLIPEQILQLSEDDKIKSLLGWFKNDFMIWTSKDPPCTKCMDGGRGKVPMQVRIKTGVSWKFRSFEIILTTMNRIGGKSMSTSWHFLPAGG